MRLVLAAVFAVTASACATASSTVPTPPADTAPIGVNDPNATTDTTTPPPEGTAVDAAPASEGPDRRADTAIRARLAALPRCAEGAVVGQLTSRRASAR